MQSLEYKKFTPQRIGIAIAAIGTLAIALTGTGMILDGNDSDNGGGSARPVVRSVERPAPAYSDAFLEWNTNLPTISDDRTFNATDGEPLEQNMTPPGTLRPAILSSDMIRFIEVNTMLPGTTTPSVVSYETTRFLEMNELPESDDAPYLPLPDRSHPGGGLTEY